MMKRVGGSQGLGSKRMFMFVLNKNNHNNILLDLVYIYAMPN